MKKYNLMAEYIRKAKKKHKNERIEGKDCGILQRKDWTIEKNELVK